VARGPVPPGELHSIALQAASALSAAHEAGFVHRDLKPANLRLTPEGRLKVLDFGLARRIRVGEADSTMRVGAVAEMAGTIAYMSPEALSGRPADTLSDLWALGVVLYELATGRRPFEGDDLRLLIHAILRGTTTRPREVHAAVAPDMEVAILRLLERDAARRYPSARALIDDLRGLSL
jgi:serine/threonine-protein kinase